MKNVRLLLTFGYFLCTVSFILGQVSTDTSSCTITVDAGLDFILGTEDEFLNLTGTGSSAIDNTALSYNWTTADGHIINGMNELSASINFPGAYIFTMSSEDCMASDTVYVLPSEGNNCHSIPIHEVTAITHCNRPTSICFDFTLLELQDAILSIDDVPYHQDIQICEGTFNQVQLNLTTGFHKVEIMDTLSNCLTYKVHVEISNHYTTCKVLEIPLVKGWNIISSNLAPVSADMEAIFSDIQTDIIVLQTDKAEIYIPTFDVQQVDNWKASEGYRIKMKEARTLSIYGFEFNPEHTDIPIQKGWQLIPYLKNTPINVMDEIGHMTNDIIMIEDMAGNVCIPHLNINDIGDFQPGQGYKLLAARDIVFHYSPNTP